MEQQPILCPICKSASLSANRETMNNTRAAIGGMMLGAQQGLLHGSMGPKNVIITCLACGYEFRPGEGATIEDFEEKNKLANQKIDRMEAARQNRRIVAFLTLVVLGLIIVWALSTVY